jgi:hypothetical protein
MAHVLMLFATLLFAAGLKSRLIIREASKAVQAMPLHGWPSDHPNVLDCFATHCFVTAAYVASPFHWYRDTSWVRIRKPRMLRNNLGVICRVLRTQQFDELHAVLSSVWSSLTNAFLQALGYITIAGAVSEPGRWTRRRSVGFLSSVLCTVLNIWDPSRSVTHRGIRALDPHRAWVSRLEDKVGPGEQSVCQDCNVVL